MRFLPVLSPLLCLTALAAPLAPAEGLRFGPEEGTELRKTFKSEIEFEIESFELLVNGEDQSGVMEGEDPSGSGVTFEEELVVVDAYASIADGRPTDFVRHYASYEADQSGDLASDSDEEDPVEDVTGTKVRFSWDADEGSYTRSFEGDEEADEDSLPKLEPDLDALAILPRGGADAGDTWTVPVRTLGSLLSPGHSVEAELASEDMDEIPEELRDMFTSTFEGMELLCTFEEEVERNGRPHARVVMELDFSDVMDMQDVILAAMEQDAGLPEGAGVEFDVADVSISCAGDGSMLWDLERGHLAGMQFELRIRLEADFAAALEMGGQIVADIEATATAALTLTREVEVE